MKKLLLSVFVIFAFIFYVVAQKLGMENKDNIAEISSGNVPAATGETVQPAVTAIPVPYGTGYRDGQYGGDVVDAYYGNVEVKALISGGRVTDVQFVQYPSDRRTSMMINSQAMPILKQEAIQAQSANVDIVSGATATSQAFIQSLQSALAKAT